MDRCAAQLRCCGEWALDVTPLEPTWTVMSLRHNDLRMSVSMSV